MNALPATGASGRSLDAIVVPTSRSAESLSYALELAKATDAFLLALCSGHTSAGSVAKRIHSQGVRGVAVHVPTGYQPPLCSDFETNNFAEALLGRAANDISVKRNVGLVVGRLAGWHSLLFLDDDITKITGIDQAIALLQNTPAAGFLVSDFPDNSVVRHAERLSGTEPGVQLGGGALLVDPMIANSFFPRIYNEDWFFLFGMHNGTFRSAIAGTAVQGKYDPFAKPSRAVSEEFGDLLAEGVSQLMNLDYFQSTESDWRRLINQRKLLIKRIRQQLESRPGGRLHSSAIRSLSAVELRLGSIQPRACVSYLAAWRRDLDMFRGRFALLSHQGASMVQILETIGLCIEQPPLTIGNTAL